MLLVEGEAHGEDDEVHDLVRPASDRRVHEARVDDGLRTHVSDGKRRVPVESMRYKRHKGERLVKVGLLH